MRVSKAQQSVLTKFIESTKATEASFHVSHLLDKHKKPLRSLVKRIGGVYSLHIH